MHDMEEGVRSAEPSGRVVKKKSSSGCLIIKKKGDQIGGFGASASKKVVNSRKEKKRPRLILSDSGSSDELLEPFRRKVVSGTDKFRNGSVGSKKGFVEDRSIGNSDQIESERKRSGLDVFEFDEYDGFDGKEVRNDCMDDRLKLFRRSGNQRESGTGSSRNVMGNKRKHSYFDPITSMLGGKSKGPNFMVKNRYEMEDDETHLPISMLREKYPGASNEPIRLQGKNGVLKVMVNKKKKLGLSDNSFDHQAAEDRKGSRSEHAVKNNVVIRPFNSDLKRPEKPVSYVRTEKSDMKLRKSSSTKSGKAGDSETRDSDASLKLGSMSVKARSTMKAVKIEEKRTPRTENNIEGKRNPPNENITPIGGKEGKVKRGSGTEKQLLREKIRSMLLNAGWTIDYRPRRNRDYLDAVYINPTGTAYWSIIKAYDALQKQSEEVDNDIKPRGDSSPFTPLPEEILSKLTRQTQKKLEREMKKKRRDDASSKCAKEANVKESVEGTDCDQREEKPSFFKKQNRKSLRGKLHLADHMSGDDSSDYLYEGMPKQNRVEKPCIQGRKSRKIGRCTLLVRSSDKGLNSETDGFVPYSGKRTVLSWLIDSGMVHMSQKVQYMNRRKTRVMQEGWITRDGVHCGCCSKILTISKFEIHAGSKQRQPFPNIFLESGLSLMQCQIDAWNRQGESERQGFHTVDMDGDDPDDDTCGLCGDGGDLICCDSCPSTFHQSCLDIQMLPPDDWHCPNCTCKFCGIASGISDESNGKTVGALLKCSLCEKKYHESCSQEVDDLPVDSDNAATSFCGQKCRELFGHLQKLLGVKHELEGGFSWSLIHRMDPFSDTLHVGFSQTVECNSKLAVALSVMDECFLPIVDRRSEINLIHNVVYNCGSNFSRLNYTGFYTAILERGDEIVSAASIRIHGTQLAEMPFIGTRHIYRRQGMCRRLLCAIESVLCSLKVEKLIIPAIAEHMHTWTEVFNFNPLEEFHKQEMRSMNMLVFPGTDMLQKLLVKQEIPDGNITTNSGTKSVELKENNLMLPVLAKNSERDSSAGHDLHECNDIRLQHANETNGKVAATDFGSQAPAIPSNDSTAMSSSVDAPPEPKLQFSSEETIPVNSQSVNKPAESTADLKCLSHTDANPVISEIVNPILDPPVKDNIQSSAEGIVGDAHEVNVKGSCIGLVLDSLGETSARNMAEAASENPNFVSVSTVHGTDESTMQFNIDSNYHSTVEMECKLLVASKVASDAEVAPGEGNIESFAEGSELDVREVNVKVAGVGHVPGSSIEISKLSNTKKINENQRFVECNIQSFAKGSDQDAQEVNAEVPCVGPVPGSSLEISADGIGEHIMQFNTELNHPSAHGMNSELRVASELLSVAEVSSDAKVASVEVNIQSSEQNSADGIYTNCYPVLASTVCCTDEGTILFNSDLNRRSALEVESQLPVASECGSEANEAPVESSTWSSAVSDMDDTHEVCFNVPFIEPIIDSFGEISAKDSAEEIIENQNPIPVSTSYGTDVITIGLDPDLNQQTALESELLLVSEVVSDVVAPAEMNIQSNGEDEAINENPTESSCGSDEKTIQLTSV